MVGCKRHSPGTAQVHLTEVDAAISLPRTLYDELAAPGGTRHRTKRTASRPRARARSAGAVPRSAFDNRYTPSAHTTILPGGIPDGHLEPVQ